MGPDIFVPQPLLLSAKLALLWPSLSDSDHGNSWCGEIIALRLRFSKHSLSPVLGSFLQLFRCLGAVPGFALEAAVERRAYVVECAHGGQVAAHIG